MRLSPTIVALLLLAAAAGCSPEPRRRVTKATSQGAGSTAAEDFQRGRDMLFKLFQYDSQEGSLRCSLFFNNYLQSQSRGDWQPSPMIDRLPRELREFSAVEQAGSLELSIEDVEYMESLVWMRDVAGWAPQGDADPLLKDWLSEQTQLGAGQSRLAQAAQLFDWTIRNLQQEPFRTDPQNPRRLQMPGILRTPRRAMLLGIGDAWERARVFIQLCRQAELDAVMLAIDGQDDSQQPAPWLPAVLLGGELYLFDTRLGLPVPLADGQGVATLSQARQSPDVLAGLSLGATLPYPVQAEDLERVVALIDAAPQALSLRMRLLEERLAGEHRLTLTVRPEQLRQRLSDAGVEARLWTVPIEAVRYERMVQRLAKSDPNAAAQMQRAKALFVGTVPLIMGRKQHLHGQFTKSPQSPGAKLRYMEMRIPDKFIQDLPLDKQVQAKLGLRRGAYQREEQWQLELRGMQGLFAEAKMHGSYWIGLVHYEEGNYEAARQWFAKRVLEEMPGSVWISGARYNLARCFEQLGEIDKARELYLEDSGSPQRHGNLLRARRWKQVQEAAGAAAP